MYPVSKNILGQLIWDSADLGQHRISHWWHWFSSFDFDSVDPRLTPVLILVSVSFDFDSTYPRLTWGWFWSTSPPTVKIIEFKYFGV